MTLIFLTLTIKSVALERSYKDKKAALIDHFRETSLTSSNASTHPALTLTNDEELDLELQSYEDELDEDSDLNSIEVSFLRNSEKAVALDLDPDSPQYVKAWAYLRYNLNLKEKDPKESFKYRLAVLDKILELQGVKSKEMIPEWLIDWFKAHRMDSLVRSFLKVGLIDDALDFAIEMVKNVSADRREVLAKRWLSADWTCFMSDLFLRNRPHQQARHRQPSARLRRLGYHTTY